MDLPWKEQATLVRMPTADQADDQSSTILFEGSLFALAVRLRDMKASERRGLRLSLPDRHVRPHSFQGETLADLIDRIPKAA
ncbi:hypothetical protein SAMN05428984_0392 [Sphingomonas sp. OK281]|nr:hypothetical protein SAMN05428984_0392 [Sphingomonas sp. OK281]